MYRSWGIGWVYGTSFVGLALIVLSLTGNAVGSLAVEGEFAKLTLGNYAQVVGDEDFLPVLWRTLILGTGTVLVLMIFAFPFAWLLTRTDFRWKGTLFVLLTAKLAIPGFITAMAYVWLFNPTAGMVNVMLGATGTGNEAAFNIYQIGWICFLQGVVLTPAAVFLMLPAFHNMDASLEEAAWVSGVSKWRAIFKIVFPVLKPGVFAIALFFFVVAVEMFDIVAVIGIPGKLDVLTIWIYDAMNPAIGFPNVGFAGAAGMMLFAICAVAIVFYIRFLNQAEKYAVVAGKSRQFEPMKLDKWHRLATGYVVFWVLCGVVLPMMALVWVSLLPFIQPFSVQALKQLHVAGLTQALTYISEPLKNTILLMVGAVVVSVGLSVCISWIVTRSRSSLARWSDMLVFLAPAVPTIVMGIAFQNAGIATYKWVPLFGTIWLVAIAMGTRFVAYCTRTLNASSIQIHYSLDEAALASGVTQFTAFRKIYLPLMFPAIFYTAILVAMLSARDLTLPLIMITENSPTVSTLIFDLQANGSSNEAAALSIYMIFLLVLLASLAHWLAGMSQPSVVRMERRSSGGLAIWRNWIGANKTETLPAE